MRWPEKVVVPMLRLTSLRSRTPIGFRVYEFRV